MQGHAERAMIIRCGAIWVWTLLECRELRVGVRDLRRAHEADCKNADQGEDLQPQGPLFSYAELEEGAHEKRRLFLFSIVRREFPTLYPHTVRVGGASNGSRG